ncbi:MAG TPA: PIG-L deacetylase family protein [Ramlibacter sp.]
MSRTVLVVAAHTDDEVLGCGGTLARHVAEGDSVHAIFLADGVSSRDGAAHGEAERRDAAARHAHQILGLASATCLGMPDNKLDSLPLLQIVQSLEAAISKISPTTVYTHHHGDLNIDHAVTHQAVMTACRPLPGSRVREILSFEVMSSTEWATPGRHPFLPNHYVDITPFMAVKMAAMRAYELEMRDEPHSRSFAHIEHLARHRGCSVGVGAAEAFMLVRSLR